MATLYMNYDNSKTSDPQGLMFSLFLNSSFFQIK